MKWKLSAALAATALSGPASAIVYVGEFTGVVTSGFRDVSTFQGGDFTHSRTDLSGRPMTLSFRTEVLDDTVGSYGERMSRLVKTDGQVVAGDVQIYFSATNEFHRSYSETAYFRGDETNALSFTHYQPNNYYYNARYYYLMAEGDRPFFGIGRAIADQTGWNPPWIRTEVDFRLTAGTVTATGVPVRADVPEPSTWALTIGGIGLAGGAIRRKRRNRLGAGPLPAAT